MSTDSPPQTQSTRHGNASVPRLLREALPPLAVLALAAYLRLSDLWLVPLKQDEAVLANRALTFLEGGAIPLAGNPSGAGVFNPPGFVYLISTAMAVYRHPIAASALLAGLGALAALLTYLVGRRYFGMTVGLAAGVLYAANPWAVWHSRDIWEPDSVHFFVLLFAIGVMALVVDRQAIAAMSSTVLLAILTQLHFSTIVLAPVWLLALVLARRERIWRWLGLGLMLSAVLYLPYAYGEVTSGWANVQRLLDQPASHATLDLTALELTRSTAADFSYFLPDDLAGGGRLATLGLWALRDGMLPLIALGAVTAAWLCWRGPWREQRAAWIVAAWLLLPIALTLWHWLALQIHYFLVLLPALCLLAGLGGRTIGEVARRTADIAGRALRLSVLGTSAAAVPAALGLVLVAGVALAQANATLVQREHLRAGDRTRFAYGVPILYTSQLADYLRSEPGSPVEVIASHSYAAEGLATLTRQQSRFSYFDGNRAFRVPARPGAMVIVLEDGTAAAEFLRQVGSDWRVHEVIEVVRPIYSVYRLPAGAAASLQRGLIPADVQMGDGLRLLGVGYPRTVRPGDQVSVAGYWRVAPGRPLNGVAVAFAGLDAQDGHELAKVQQDAHDPAMDGVGGDWLGWMTIQTPEALPDGAGSLTLGLFWSPGVRAVTVTNSVGHDIGDRLRLGPIRLVGQSQASPPPKTRLDARVGTTIALDGYDAEWQGSVLDVRLHWRALAKVERDYQAFAHLIDKQGGLLGQHDTQPGQLPTSLWEPGDSVLDVHRLEMSPGAPTDDVRVSVGLYSLADGARLPITTAEGSALGDSIDLFVPPR